MRLEQRVARCAREGGCMITRCARAARAGEARGRALCSLHEAVAQPASRQPPSRPVVLVGEEQVDLGAGGAHLRRLAHEHHEPLALVRAGRRALLVQHEDLAPRALQWREEHGWTEGELRAASIAGQRELGRARLRLRPRRRLRLGLAEAHLQQRLECAAPLANDAADSALVHQEVVAHPARIG